MFEKSMVSNAQQDLSLSLQVQGEDCHKRAARRTENLLRECAARRAVNYQEHVIVLDALRIIDPARQSPAGIPLREQA